jgi:hypothetical protein
MSATTTAARGRGVRLAGKLKDSLNGSVEGNFQALTFRSESIARQNDLPDDNELGLTLDNARDATDPGPGLPTASGQISVNADLNQLLFWLSMLLGAPESTGAEAAWTHVFKSGAPALKYADLEFALPGNQYQYIPGIAANEWTFGVQKADGYRTFGFSLIGRDRVAEGSSAAGTPVAVPARARVPASKGVVRLNSVIAGQLVGGDLTFSNNFEPVPLADDDALINRMDPGDATLTGQPRLRFARGAAANGALDLFADHATPFGLEVEYALSATSSLLIAVPRCFAPRVTPSAEGPGAIEVTASLRAAQGPAAPLMTVTLKNALETI